MEKYPNIRLIRRTANSSLSHVGALEPVSRRFKPIAAERQTAGEHENIEKHFD